MPGVGSDHNQTAVKKLDILHIQKKYWDELPLFHGQAQKS